MTFRNVWGIAALLVLTSYGAKAAAVIHEPFNYATGGLNGKGGTTEVGLTGTWAADATTLVVGNSLVYGSLPASGGSIGNLTYYSNKYGGVRAVSASALAANGLLDNGTNLWFSLELGYGRDASGTPANISNARLAVALANSTFNTGNFKFYINNEGSQLGSGLGVLLGPTPGGNVKAAQYRDSVPGATGYVLGTWTGTAYMNDQHGLIVGKIIWGATAGDLDRIELYQPGADLVLPASPVSVLEVIVDQSTYDAITFARGDPVVLDEIRFGASYADVVPIPTGAPVIVSLSPTNEAVNVTKSITMVATFNKPVQLTGSGSVTITNLTLDTAEVITLPDSRVTMVDYAFLKINPSANLDNSTHYAVLISSDVITALDTETFAGISDPDEWDFLTTDDATAPTITAASPADGTNGGILTPLRATFSENVLLTGTGTIKVRNVTLGSDIQTYTLPNANVSISGSALTILSTVRRTTNTTYAVQISSSAIEDLGGNLFAGTADETSWDFTTLTTFNYEWSGTVDANWNNPANWNVNGVPIDTLAGGNLELYSGNRERIVFNAPLSTYPVPTLNIPALGGDATGNRDNITPQLDVLAGTLTFSAVGFGSQGLVRDQDYPWTMTVGDGDTGNGSASLTLNGGFSNAINRDQMGSMVWTIKADGAVTLDAGGTTTLIFAYDTGRPANFILDGGSLTTPDALDMLRGSTAYGPSYIEFTDKASTFTATFGVDFPDVATVSAQCGAGLTFRSTVGALKVTDNGNNTFKVSVAPPAGTIILLR